MPKQTHVIDKFHGGINSNADPRDIEDNQSPLIENIKISNLGKLELVGSFQSIDIISGTSVGILDGRGLGVFKSDKKLNGSNSNETILALYDDDTNSIALKDSSGWIDAKITTFDSDLPVFHVADGNLRVGDGEFDDAINNKWFGYIENHRFAGLRAGSSQPEITFIYCVADTSNSLDGKYFDIYGADNHKFQIWIDVGNTGTSQPTGSGSYDHNIEVTGISTNDTAATVATQIASSIDAHGEFSATAYTKSADTSFVPFIIITSSTKESLTDAVAGNTGFTIVVAQQGTSDGSVGKIAWTQADQPIASPTLGTCIISTPYAGSNGLTDLRAVNSTVSEYYGNIADNSPPDAATIQSVNLRVGLQYNELLNVSGASGLAGTNASLSDDVTEIYPLIANNNIKATGSGNSTIVDVTETSMNYSIDEERSFVYAFYITSSEYEDLVKVTIQHSTNDTGGGGSANTLNYTFLKEEIKSDCWNLLVCSSTNIDYATAALGDTFTRWDISVLDSDSGDTAPTFYLSGPVLIQNVPVNGFPIGTYTFHHTYLYDDEKQESLPFKFADVGSSLSKNVNKLNILGSPLLLNFDSYINPCDNSSVYSFNKRITGSRLYYKLEENDNFFLIGELDFVENGFKWFPEGTEMSYSMVNTTGAGSASSETFFKNAVIVKGITPVEANGIDTYKNINGFGGFDKHINAKYKTSVIHGRRTYIGNIRQPANSNGINYPDRMLKSSINKFDVFPSEVGKIDVAINDGESIIKLEAFADRILQFKEKTLYIINISENVDFLEDTIRDKGCAFDYHVAKTDFGIAWFNKLGLYFFDGQKVINLLEKNGQRLINQDDWRAFLEDGEDGSSDDLDISSAHIAYSPETREIFIKNENTDMYIYDFVLKSLTRAILVFLPIGNHTNFIINKDSKMSYITQSSRRELVWDNDAQHYDGFVYVTKDIDFGQPSVRKKIYKVYISYTSTSGSVPSFTYGVNGDTALANTPVTVTAFAQNQPQWTQAEYKFNSDANNCFSIQLKIGTAAQSINTGFQINDITIVYRLKRPR